MLRRLHMTLLSISLITNFQSSLAEDNANICHIKSTDAFTDLMKTINELKCEMVPSGDSPHFQKDLST